MIRSFIFYILFLSTLSANVTIKAPSSFIAGEAVFFSIEAIGENIIFPKIDKIENYEVKAAGQSSSFSNINGKISSKIEKRYRFFPTSDVTILPLKFSISNKDFFTKEHKIVKQKIGKTKSDYFDLNIKLSNNELYIGEQTILTMTFKYKKGLQLIDTAMRPPEFKDFWYKRLEPKEPYEEGLYVVQNLKYLLFPQKSGKLKLEPLRVDASVLDTNSSAFAFFQKTTKNIKIYSNTLDVKVQHLPKGINLIGDFDISASVDKTKINLGEAVSYKVEITGYGNIEDLEELKLEIPEVTIYDNKPVTTGILKNNRYFGTYKKSFSLLPTESLVIPAISLSYFDKNTNKVVNKQTQEVKIEVVGIKQTISKLQKNDKKVEATVITKEASLYAKLAYYILGIVTTLLIFGLYKYVINKRKQKIETPLDKRIKKAINKKDLMKEILPYISKNENLDSLIFKLESCEDSNLKAIKKEIIETLKDIK